MCKFQTATVGEPSASSSAVRYPLDAAFFQRAAQAVASATKSQKKNVNSSAARDGAGAAKRKPAPANKPDGRGSAKASTKHSVTFGISLNINMVCSDTHFLVSTICPKAEHQPNQC